MKNAFVNYVNSSRTEHFMGDRGLDVSSILAYDWNYDYHNALLLVDKEWIEADMWVKSLPDNVTKYLLNELFQKEFDDRDIKRHLLYIHFIVNTETDETHTYLSYYEHNNWQNEYVVKLDDIVSDEFKDTIFNKLGYALDTFVEEIGKFPSLYLPFFEATNVRFDMENTEIETKVVDISGRINYFEGLSFRDNKDTKDEIDLEGR